MLKYYHEEHLDGHTSSSGMAHDDVSLMGREHWKSNKTLKNRNVEVLLSSEESVHLAGGHDGAIKEEGYVEEWGVLDHLMEL